MAPKLALRKVVLSARRARILRRVVVVELALIMLALVAHILPAHREYEGSSFDGIGFVFVGTCGSGGGYVPSTTPKSTVEPPVVDNVHSLFADFGPLLAIGLAIAISVLGALARPKRFVSETCASAAAATTAVLTAGGLVVASLTHLFGKVDTLWPEYVFGGAVVALLVASVFHFTAVQLLFRRERIELAANRPLPLAWLP